MATKPSKPGTAVVKAHIALPANINEQYATEVAALTARLSVPSGDRILITQAKTFKLLNGMEVDELDCVIVDFVAANYYYNKLFDRNNIVPPVCFAINLEPANLTPSDNSTDKQHDTCTGCWADQFKTAANGRGKACSNTRLLALLPLDADDSTPIQLLKVSSTGLRAFDSHVSHVATKYGVPIRGVSTRITMGDTEYSSLRFAVIDRLTPKDVVLGAAQAAQPAALVRLMVEPNVTQAPPPPVASKRPPARPAAKTLR